MNLLFRMNYGVLYKRGEKVNHLSSVNQMNPFYLVVFLRCPDCGQGMVPSITTYTRKDGTKRKHRYYVCSDFHNKGSAACKANSIKAYEAEDTVIKKIEHFSSNKKRLSKTITDISSRSAHSIRKHKIE